MQKRIPTLQNHKIFFLLVAMSFLISCTEKKPPIPKAAIELNEKIEKMEKELKEKDTKLKVSLDHGLTIELTHDRELLNSRLEREKIRMNNLYPNFKAELDAKGGAGGAEGGAHH